MANFNNYNIQKDRVVFTDTSAEVKSQMQDLSKKALRQASKTIRKILKSNVPKKSGNFSKSIAGWARIDRSTGQPTLDIGYLSRKRVRQKYGVKFFANPAWFEFGTRRHLITTTTKILTDGNIPYGKVVVHPGMGGKNFLRNTVMENIAEIRSAQEEYLGHLTKLIISVGGVIPPDYEGEVEDD